ncbi:MAG: hypothetical protein HOM21_10060, partial [Halobacteriovoraceae bacterium]|nr:hypothetical protein [Halobacteriovoraceae bacterium]
MIINAMTPARIGSTRLKMKNLALAGGRPMIEYVLEAAKNSKVFDSITVNSDHQLFKEIAERSGVSFYLRPEELGSSTTKSDDVVYDFMQKVPGDITVWVNSISPLQSPTEIASIIKYFQDEKLDCLQTVRDEQAHCLQGDEPLNFSTVGKFAQTQDLVPIRRFVYSIMMWRNSAFMKEYEKSGSAFFCGKPGYYSISKESAIIVKTEEDIRLVD